MDKAGSGWSIAFCDTVARSLVGADENSSQERGLWVAAADSIKSHCKCAFVGVHHSGKNVANGMRGSSALLGAVDTSLVVTKDEEYVTMRVEKQKDATPAEDQAFRMTEVAMISGTSVVLERVTGDVQRKAKKVRPSKGAQEIAFMALQNLLIDRNEKQVHYDDWKAKHERNTPDSTADQRYQARRGLQAKGLVVIDDNKCWINSNLAE